METQLQDEGSSESNDGQLTPSQSLTPDSNSYPKIPTTDAMRKSISEIVDEGLQRDDLNVRRDAAMFGLDIEAHNLRVQQARDHNRRLDAGEPTQIVGTGDSLAARAGSLLSSLRAMLEKATEERVEIKSVVNRSRDPVKQLRSGERVHPGRPEATDSG